MMNERVYTLIERLTAEHRLTLEEYRLLIEKRTPEAAAMLAERAVAVRKQIYGNAVFTRGLIEISNICKNDCLFIFYMKLYTVFFQQERNTAS